ncbi:MAG: hypothetical protein ACOZCO_02925 [Bacteroidota bacterium]
MKKIILAVVFLFSMSYCFSQATTTKPDPKPTIFKTVAPGQTVTLKLTLTGYSMNVLGELKDCLLTWTGKVLSVSLNETTKEMQISYNEFMLKEDFLECFRKNGVDYFVHTPQQTINAGN